MENGNLPPAPLIPYWRDALFIGMAQAVVSMGVRLTLSEVLVERLHLLSNSAARGNFGLDFAIIFSVAFAFAQQRDLKFPGYFTKPIAKRLAILATVFDLVVSLLVMMLIAGWMAWTDPELRAGIVKEMPEIFGLVTDNIGVVIALVVAFVLFALALGFATYMGLRTPAKKRARAELKARKLAEKVPAA